MPSRDTHVTEALAEDDALAAAFHHFDQSKVGLVAALQTTWLHMLTACLPFFFPILHSFYSPSLLIHLSFLSTIPKTFPS